jgi:hypothetical protein
MIINSELLKEAIADAKAVRATALSNAKASLEEAFAPRFEAMFAEKLKEESEDELMAEHEAPNQVSGKGGEAKGPATKPVSKGEPKKAPKSGPGDGQPYKTVAVGGSEGATGSKAPAAKQTIVKETEDADKDDEKDEKMDESAEAGLTTEDLDAIIKELESEVDGGEEGEVPAPAPAPEIPAPSPVGEVPPAAPCAPVAPLPVQPQGGMVPQLPPAPVVGGDMGIPPAPVVPPVDGQVPPAEDEQGGGVEEINLEELLAALNEEADKEDKEDEEKLDEISNNGLPKNVSGQDKSWTQTSDKNIEAKKQPNTTGEIGGGEVTGKPKMEEATKYKVALKEAYDTIGFLRGQINEVNLLNAKLLYTNKLFKEFAGVLDDTYRMKIVENFDLTKSVREVKLAYALLAESLNFGTKSSASRNLASKPVQRKSVTQITEGLASKPVASTKPSKEILSEGSEMATRFQKLAGIKKLVK